MVRTIGIHHERRLAEIGICISKFPEPPQHTHPLCEGAVEQKKKITPDGKIFSIPIKYHRSIKDVLPENRATAQGDRVGGVLSRTNSSDCEIVEDLLKVIALEL